MRGIIFRTYLSFLTDRFGYKVTDRILLQRNYPNKGGFSSAGNYDVAHLEQLISDSTYLFDNSEETVWSEFGEFALPYLIETARRAYGKAGVITKSEDLYEFLENLNVIHHEELHKIYHNAKFPNFKIDRVSPRSITIEYSGGHGYSFFVYGLLKGSVQFFNDPSCVTMKRIDTSNSSQTAKEQVFLYEVSDEKR